MIVNNPFIPTTLEVNSLGIGFSSLSNLYNLDLNIHEYLVIGERENTTGIREDQRYNMIVNNQGVAINTNRSTYNCNNNLYNAGLYVDNNIVCSGNIIAKGLQFDNITLADNINASAISNLITTINDRQDLIYKSTYKTNITNINGVSLSTIDNIYTPSYLTIGGNSVTANNKNALSVVETTNNTAENMQFSIRNSSVSDDEFELGGGKIRIGIIGGNFKSPAVITTTEGMSLEFHVGVKSAEINKLYQNGLAFPEYSPSTIIPAMTIDEKKNVGFGLNKTNLYNFSKYVKTGNRISTFNISEYAKVEIKGTLVAENLLLYDYITNSYLHLNDLFIRTAGYAIGASQVREGTFYGDLYEFSDNLIINSNLDVGTISVNTGSFNSITTCNILVNTATFNDNAIFSSTANIDINSKLIINNELYISDANNLFIDEKRVNILDVKPLYLNPILLETCNISYSSNSNNSILFFASENVINFSGSNLIIPGKIGIGVSNDDNMLEQVNIVKKEIEKFEIALHDKSDEGEISSAFIGHLTNYNDKQFDRDNSLIINTNKTFEKYNNIYFMPGIDILNRSSKNLNENITLSVNQNKKIGINTTRPLYELDVNGSIITNDIYIRKNNGNVYKTNNFSYELIGFNTKVYNMYDKYVNKYCINYLEDTINFLKTDDLKTLNVNGSINANSYYENNISIESFKNKYDNTGVFTNKMISLGWVNESSVVPLQIRNISTNNYNNSIIRIYRGKRGGGINNNASYSGIDICDYEIIPGYDRNNYKWYIYKNHLNLAGTANENLVGPLQIGYTDNTTNPDPLMNKAMSIFYNNEGTYHIDINKEDGNFNFNKNAAMSIYGDLEVYGNINIIDTNNCNYIYKLNGIQYSSNAITNIINQLPNLSNGINESNGNIVNNIDKNDIVINAEKITILPNKTTLIGYSENWFLHHINNLQTQNIETPLIVYQKNKNTPITRFASTSYEKSIATIELGTYDINTYNGTIKNMVSMNVSGNLNEHNNNTLLEFGSYDTIYDKTYIPFLSFYHNNSNEFSSCYTHLGGSKYPSRDVNTGSPIVNDVALHIEDISLYGLQITSHEKAPIINLHKKNGSNSIYYIINGVDEYNNFSINTAVSYDNSYVPDNITPILTINGVDENGLIRKGSRVGLNKTVPITALDIDSVTNESCIKFTNKYDELKLDNYFTNITVVASNMYAQPKLAYKDDNTYYTGINYTINSNDLPLIDNNDNVIIDNYKRSSNFIVTKNISLDNFINYKLKYNYNTDITTTNISTNIISSNYNFNFINNDIDINNTVTYDLNPIINSFNTDNTIYVPENSKINYSNIYSLSLNTSNFTGSILFTSNYNINYNYNNFYKGPQYLNYNYDEFFNIKNKDKTITYDIFNYKYILNVNNYFDTYLYNSNLCNKSNIEIYENIIYIDNIILNTYTSNIIHYYSLNTIVNADLEILRNKNIIINTLVTAPIKLIKDDYSLLSFTCNISVIGGIYNININKVTDFLNVRPDGFNFTESLETSINTSSINTCNYIFHDIFIENDITFDSIINIHDNYELYDYNLANFYIGINYLNYEPHIILENLIKLDGYNAIDIDNVHKIYSYDGDFRINILSEGSENNLVVVSKFGDMNVKNSVTTNDIYLEGKIYDKLGNDIINIINNYDYTSLLYYHDIHACNYYIESSNMKFTPTGDKGFIINSGQNIINTDETYNIFTVYDNDENNKYTRFNIKKEGFVSINKDIGDYALDVSGIIQSDDDIITPNLHVIGGDNCIVEINTPMYLINYFNIYNSNYANSLNINHVSSHHDILSINEDNNIIFNITKGGKIGINKNADDIIDLDITGNMRVSDTIFSSNLIIYGNTVELTTVKYKTENLEIITEAADDSGFTIRQNGTENILDFYNMRQQTSIVNDETIIYNTSNHVMTVTNAGDLGLGLKIPEYNLHVRGEVKFNSNLYVSGISEFAKDVIFNEGVITSASALTTVGSNLDVRKDLLIRGSSEFIGEIVTNNGIITKNSDIRTVNGNIYSESNISVLNNMSIGVNNNVNNNYRLQINNSITDIGLAYDKSNCNLYVKNDIIASAFSQLSDANVKTNIVDLEYNDDLMNLRPVSFKWSSNYYNQQKIGDEDVGLIAQEVEMHIPGLVFDNIMLDGNTWKTVNYTGLIPYMIKHIQHLNKRIETLENTNKRIEILEYKLNNM